MNHLIRNLLSLVLDTSSNGTPGKGCSKHFFIDPDNHCIGKRPVTFSYTVGLPNGHTMSAMHIPLLATNRLPPSLSTLACRAYVFSAMTNHPLLSIGQFSNNGYDSTFTSRTVVMSKDG